MALRLEKLDGISITDEVIREAAQFFTQCYGVWGPLAADKMDVEQLREGTRVKMSPRKLASQLLPKDAYNVYIRGMVKQGGFFGAPPGPPEADLLAGHVFATRWTYNGRHIVWVTQLCVRPGYRRLGIAKKLLEALRGDEWGMGVLSSHPHAILAVSHVYGRPTASINLTTTRDHAREIMESSPIPYVKKAKLHGTLFGEEVDDGSVSCADTQFWVDHFEPLAVLEEVHEKGVEWPFGDLPEGHEFLILVEAKGKEDEKTGNHLDLR